MTRAEHIATQLTMYENRGVIADWYSYSPGDRYGKRWVMWAPSFQRTYSTREVECFLDGVVQAERNLRALQEREER